MNINPEFLWEFFSKNPLQYNLRKGDIVYLPPVRPSCYAINSLIITVGKFQGFDWLRGVQLIINFCVTKEKHTLRTSRITKCEK